MASTADSFLTAEQPDKFREQLGSDYRSDLDLIFANPDGTPLKPDRPYLYNSFGLDAGD